MLAPLNAAVSTEISDTPATTAAHPSHPGYLPLKGRTIAQCERWVLVHLGIVTLGRHVRYDMC